MTTTKRFHLPQTSTSDVDHIVTFFISAGSLWDADRPPSLFWLPYTSGRLLRFFWRKACEGVQQRVSARAFELMSAEFDRGGPARQFESWPVDQRREIYALCQTTGAMWWVDEHGNSLPIGVRSIATYREDLARLRAANDDAD
ncbi:hypothetical protein [Reyranella sp.]|uniref:hypothetical protein n=1 Tax=Reyranella sp. TaxID=1929291 RepID=UPI003D0AA650